LDVDSSMILRLIIDNMNYTDVIATWDNLDEYKDASIMCIVPQDGKLIVELA